MVTVVPNKSHKDQTRSRQRNQSPAIAANSFCMPAQLRNNTEQCSGLSLDRVQIHYNSTKPSLLQPTDSMRAKKELEASRQERHAYHELEHLQREKQELERIVLNLDSIATKEAVRSERDKDDKRHKSLNLLSHVVSNTSESVRKPIQRKIGFEVELSVPTMRSGWAENAIAKDKVASATEGKFCTRLPNNEERSNVYSFLGGGAIYGMDYGRIKGAKIEADHNDLQNSQLKIVNKMIQMGYVDECIAAEGQPMSNMEYITEPVDTNGDGWNDMKSYVEEITEHAKETAGNAKNEPLRSIRGTKLLTGFPRKGLEKLLGEDLSVFQSDIENFHQAISSNFYLQATAGIIPSAINKLLKSYGDSIANVEYKQGTISYARAMSLKFTNELVDRMTKSKLIEKIARLVFGQTKSNHDDSTLTYIANETIKGVIQLSLQRMIVDAIGDAYNNTGITSKNIYLYLPKVASNKSIRDAFSRALRISDLTDNKSRMQLLKLEEFLWKKVFDFALTRLELENIRDIEERFSDVFLGDYPRSSSKYFDSPDAEKSVKKHETGFQSGVQMEYRIFKPGQNIDDLLATVKSVFDQVQETNGSLRDKEMRGQFNRKKKSQ